MISSGIWGLDGHKVMPPDDIGEDVWTAAGACHVLEARLETNSVMFVLKDEETAALWPQESARVGTSVSFQGHVE